MKVQKFLDTNELKRISSTDLRLHYNWLEKQNTRSLRTYLVTLRQRYKSYKPRYVFSKEPDLRTKKGVLEYISRYYNHVMS